MPDQGDEVRQIEMLAQIMLPVSPLPELPLDRPRVGGEGRFQRGFDRGGSHGGHGGHERGSRPTGGEYTFYEGERSQLPDRMLGSPRRRPSVQGRRRPGGGGGRPFGRGRR